MTAVVVPVRKESLYQIEERLTALFDSEEFIADNEPDAAAHLHQEIAQTIEAELAKVDGIAAYLAHCENQQAFASSDIKRLQERKAKYERRQQRIECSVMAILQTQGRARIEGNTSFLALRSNPPSLEMVDEQIIPGDYKTTVITSETKVDKALIKRVIKAKIDVPGVRLVTDKQRLVRG